MGQCEKILDNGERCSNQAVPGTRYCSTHGRITFRKVREDKAADTAPPPKPPAAKTPAAKTPAAKTPAAKTPAAKTPAAKTPASQPAWRAVPSPSGQPPAFPGLRADERNILVGPEGVVWLAGDSEDNGQVTPFNRLVKLLGFLSQALPLHAPQEQPQVRIMRQPEPGDCLVLLRPSQPQAAHLSTFYDAVSTAARLVSGRLYVGQGEALVQYRDDSAPRGYDVPEFRPDRPAKGLLLIARWGSRHLDLGAFAETSLADLALEVAPVPDVTGPLPALVYALAARPLYAMMARYLRAHSLRYRLAHLQAGGAELILFEIQPNPETRGEAVLPAFALDYLARLPRVALLRPAAESPAMLLQWGHRYPLHLPGIRGAFAEDELIVLSRSPYANSRVRPAPQFLDGERLTDVYMAQDRPLQLTAREVVGVPALRLPLLLRPDYGPVPPTAALILSPQETAWLRPLLYRLPGNALADYLLCQGEAMSVLVGRTMPLEGIPFGIPLQQLGDTGLFSPLRSRFVPALPWPMLRQALQVQENVYTFLTETYRLDIAVADFHPLSRAIVAEKRGAAFQLQPLAALPNLRWQPRPRPVAGEEPGDSGEPAVAEEEPGWLERLVGGRKPKKGEQPAVRQAELPPAPEWAGPAGNEVELTAYLQEQATAYEQQGEMLPAAFCYELLGDTANSARCYRLGCGGLAAS